MLKERIAEKLNDHLNGTGLFLVDIKATPQGRIMVFIDGEQNVTIDQCVEISRMLEEFLESENLVRENYVLEVSSPGMGQPFRVRQQYLKSVGRSLEVLKKDGIKLEGILKEVDENNIRLQVEKKKKGKVISSQLMDVAFEEIKTTKQLITFK
jgi:ribosome maturation factor RimP